MNKNPSLAAQRAYQREWRKKNRDKVREYNERYWLKRAKQLKLTEGEQEVTKCASDQRAH